MWSSVSEHPSLGHSMEPVSLSLVFRGLEGEMGGRGDFQSTYPVLDAVSGALSAPREKGIKFEG